MTESLPARYRLDDLRRLATSLAARLGVAPARASALATHLLWFDAAGASSHGIASLPTWLERLERKQVDPVAVGRPVLEHAGTAVFDASNGLAPLALEAAAGVASEKARDVGVGIVRVRNVGPTGPSAAVASGLAIGPFAALIAGPGGALSIALPTPEGSPAIYDSGLAGGDEPPSPPEGWSAAFGPWVATLAGGDGWVILALSVPAMESLSSFHERVASTLGGRAEGGGRLLPEALAARRQAARDRGVPVARDAMARLEGWAGRLDVPRPAEFGG